MKSKWMNWQPSVNGEKETEVPKVPQVGFVTSGIEHSVQVQIFRAVSTPLGSLDRWAMGRCVFRDRQWGGVKGLYRDYCRWAARADDTPVLEDEFTEWLAGAGMIVDSYGMVYGLVLGENGRRVQ